MRVEVSKLRGIGSVPGVEVSGVDPVDAGGIVREQSLTLDGPQIVGDGQKHSPKAVVP